MAFSLTFSSHTLDVYEVVATQIPAATPPLLDANLFNCNWFIAFDSHARQPYLCSRPPCCTTAVRLPVR